MKVFLDLYVKPIYFRGGMLSARRWMEMETNDDDDHNHNNVGRHGRSMGMTACTTQLRNYRNERHLLPCHREQLADDWCYQQ